MRYRNTVHNYLFGPDSQTYKGEMPENVSTVYIRLGCFLYLTAIYLWAIIRMRSYLDNIIYLTMIGYFITWLYFGLTMQRYLMDVMNRGNQRKYTAPSYLLL